MDLGTTPLPTTPVVESVARLAEVAWDQVEPSALPAAAVELARAKAMLEAQLVSLAEQIEVTDASAEAGWASTKDFLTHVLGGHKGAGGGVLRLAKQARHLPQVRDAFARGEVSVDQARVIARNVTTLPRDPELREVAAARLLDRATTQAADATDLDRAFPDVVRELDPDGNLLGDDLARDRKERGAHAARFLSLAPDAVGGVRMKGYGTLEDAELIKTVLQTLAAPVTSEPGACGGTPGERNSRIDDQGRHVRTGCPDPDCAHDGRDPRDSGARLWDALIDACGRLQATDDLPRDHGTTARIHVTMTLADLRAQLRDHGLGAPRGSLPATACSTPATGSRPQRSDGWPATPRSSRSSSGPAPRSSTSAAPSDWSPPPSGSPWCSATGTAPSPAAPGLRSRATPTTSDTGPTADQRPSTTSCCCADITTR